MILGGSDRRLKKSNHRRQYPLLLCPFVLLVAGFELGPLLAMIRAAFCPMTEAGDTGAVRDGFQSKYYVQGIRNSVMISLFSAGISIVVALFAACASRGTPARRDRLL